MKNRIDIYTESRDLFIVSCRYNHRKVTSQNRLQQHIPYSISDRDSSTRLLEVNSNHESIMKTHNVEHEKNNKNQKTQILFIKKTKQAIVKFSTAKI